MTHQNNDTFAKGIAENGLEAIPETMRVLINNVIQVERTKYLQTDQYKPTRNGRNMQTVSNRT